MARYDRSEPLYEGPCAYAVETREGYEVIVYSTNCVRHLMAGVAKTAAQAERVTRRLNAYPDQTRKFHGLL
jgi:hypothetical protein